MARNFRSMNSLRVRPASHRGRVLRGAGRSLYGSPAIGGVVNVLSQEGEGPPKRPSCRRAERARRQEYGATCSRREASSAGTSW